MIDTSDHEKQLKEINETVYKHSLELAVKNKTLALLGTLYEIATLALAGEEMATRVTTTIQSEFDFEMVGMLAFNEQQTALHSLAVASSPRVAEIVDTEILKKHFGGPIAGFRKIQESVSSRHMAYTEDFMEMCGTKDARDICARLVSEGQIRASLVYPLIVNEKVIGVLFMSLNRGYGEIVEYEREAMQSFVGVIAIALDKVLLYEELEATNAKLRDLDQQKNEFLSFASHQLRTPLTAIKWSAGAILDQTFGTVPKELVEPVRTIFEESSLMAVFINDYLNVSRIEQGRMEYRFVDTNLFEVLHTTISQMEPSVHEKGLTIALHADEKDLMVWADASKLTQVISNLIDNAVKYTPTGGITISMRALPEGKVRVEMQDTGIGMDKETLGKMFEKFSRGENAKVVNGAGSGLGLFIVKTFVEAHKGTIRVASDGVGKGTLFTIEFPLVAKK